jgi:hypothetical protein
MVLTQEQPLLPPIKEERLLPTSSLHYRAAGTSTVASSAFKGALKERELQFASAGSREECVLLTLHALLRMRPREDQSSRQLGEEGRRQPLGAISL